MSSNAALGRAEGDLFTRRVCEQLENGIKTCRIQHPHFDNHDAAELCKALSEEHSRVQKLEFYKCPSLGSKGITDVAKILHNTKTVTRWDIASVSIGDEGLQAITQLLESESCPLEWLSLVDISGLEKGDEPHLITLETWNHFFQAALKSDSKLKSLDLTHNFLTLDHMEELSNCLRLNTTLESLILSRNPLGDDGVCMLCCHALQANTALTLLALGDCNISNEGSSALAKCLRTKNCHLERVYLYANPHITVTDSNSKEEVLYWLDVNSKGRKMIREQACRSEYVPIILAKVTGQLDHLYGLFHEYVAAHCQKH